MSELKDFLKKNVIEQAEKLKGKKILLSFSCGADSICSFFRLRELGIEPVPFYLYFIKDLQMTNNYLDYFQKKYIHYLY